MPTSAYIRLCYIRKVSVTPHQRRKTLARRGSGLRTAIKVVKAIDRANRQAARESQRRQKARERAHAHAMREHEREVRSSA